MHNIALYSTIYFTGQVYSLYVKRLYFNKLRKVLKKHSYKRELFGGKMKQANTTRGGEHFDKIIFNDNNLFFLKCV